MKMEVWPRIQPINVLETMTLRAHVSVPARQCVSDSDASTGLVREGSVTLKLPSVFVLLGKHLCNDRRKVSQSLA